MPVISLVYTIKLEKLPNPLIFDRNQNNLYPFITKLRLKLLINNN
jgi:hypothetical protein